MQNKIKDMSLEQKTLEYWKISQSWNGTGESLATGVILKRTCALACFTNPSRTLMKHVLAVEEDIIVGKRAPARKTQSK